MNGPPRPTLRNVLFWGVLATQLLVPIAQLGQPRPARFGWQMFSGGRPRVEFRVELADGTVEPIDVGDYLARERSEVDLASALPPHLCRRIDGVEIVRVRVAGAPETNREYRCP